MFERFAKILRRAGRIFLRAVRFLSRDLSSGVLLVRMAAWVVVLSLLIRVMPLPRIMKLITPRRRHRASTGNSAALQAKLARLIDLLLGTNFWVFTRTCWKRAPVLHRYLALSGIETRIVFGVRREGEGVLNGHAWLEARGEPVLESSVPEYTVTYSFPA
ncbi:MAG TPA: lasso peptide biosynthesis B2 protein [Pyrinomonadaceae bacterium]|jgi:hypothetical protein